MIHNHEVLSSSLRLATQKELQICNSLFFYLYNKRVYLRNGDTLFPNIAD